MNSELLHPRPFITPEASSTLSRELPFEGAETHIGRMHPTLQRRAKKERSQRRADRYHEVIYRRISAGLGKVSDATDLPLTQIVNMGFAGHLINLAANRLDDFTGAKFIEDIDGPLGVAIDNLNLPLTILALTAISFFPNARRTPHSEKMGLRPISYSIDDELHAVIDQLNKRTDAPQLAFKEIGPLAATAVGDLLERYDGYRTGSTTKPKRAWRPAIILDVPGSYGLTNPAIGEVLLKSEVHQEPHAHELAHAKGVYRETEATLVGIVAQIESGNPSLEYIGYLGWLHLLTQTPDFYRKFPYEDAWTKVLGDLGLNERTLTELQSRWEYEQIAIEDRLRTTRKIGRAASKIIPPQLKLKKKSYPVRNLILKASGQPKISDAYITEPIQLLADYRTKHLSGNST